ncbi:Acyl-coenzyme A thioesterase PaaI, contains HGG motif [Selenomonas sp. GACV-9]|uniref:PaaI family thioesterase n=1 Tax=Selenomonas sp. GACV-9 TaxID=3158782 RepID=UPI0008E2C9C4|nr:Acyl-coenzyme A thioesterase PaaI, contains HGG motif [Selenomonas ruminantium]
MPSTKEKLPGENYCFACGPENPIGLHLDFHFEEDKYVAEKTLPHEYQSYEGVVHGGIITTMLDEAMGGYLYSGGERAVTARLDVRYRKTTPVGEHLVITSWEESRRGSFVNMKATIALADGTVTAEGTAKMALVD